MFHFRLNPRPPPSGGDARPCRRLLGDHQDPGRAAVGRGIGLLQEGDGLEVLPAAVHVRPPLPVRARVVEVEHRGDRVHPQPVDVELLEPVRGVGDEEVAHLVPAEVEDVGTPVRLLAEKRVRVLVQGRPVEPAEGPLVLGEVRRNPVQQDADARLVQPVDEVAEVVGVAEPRRRRVVGADLVPPRPTERVLRDREELDVGEAEGLHVLGEMVGQLPVAQTLPPGPQVDLVHAHRAGVCVVGHPMGEPRRVLPGVPGLHDDGCRRGRGLGALGHRVGLLPPRTVLLEDLVLVALPTRDPRDEELPVPARAQLSHRVRCALPVVEVADDTYCLSVRRPDRERRSADVPQDAGVGVDVGPENLPELLVAPFGDEVEVDVADARQEPVRVVGEVDLAAVCHPQPVVGHLGAGDRGEPDTAVLVLGGVHLGFGARSPCHQHVDGVGQRS
jgi:hypothetical protein